MDNDREDGEMSDENEMDVDVAKEDIKTLPVDGSTLLYKADKTGPIVKHLNKVDALKLEERAQRFGLNLSGNRVVTQKQIDDLYANVGIEGNERHFRLDALHLTGIDGLTTKDVFEYLEDYKPVSLEWIDETSCNIVCQDHIAAALALLVHSREITDEDLKNVLSERSSYHWREGMPHPKKDVILMRFATNGDKKIGKKIRESTNVDSNEKNPWGELCKSWGVYDHQEIFQRKLPEFHGRSDDEEVEVKPRKFIKPRNKNLAMRLGKRSQKIQNAEESSDSDSEWNKKSKVPRMRMRADDEESKRKSRIKVESNSLSDKDEYAPLSIEVINSQSAPMPNRSSSKLISEKFKKHESVHSSKNIQSRLGVKVVPQDDRSFSDSCSDDSDYNTMSRVQKVNVRNTKTSSVWSRLEANPGLSNDKTDLRQILKTRKHKKSDPRDDLRERLGKTKTNLRIEIDNNYAD
ncbi:nuclear cap-binding protein subunit 3-like [Colias croceus]|uniref:nuclear cap-binding protein subunit 3-like n=1 Tax=Colias crocea TaxID=72248 RepID=UPI001E27C35D|nr:nuclear cap-binding protein subunit 3-like [Colias croceus]